jgi:ketosteroid isomerase-like protein
VESDEQQILKLFEDGDRALIEADLPELSRVFADDYVQYDETGTAHTKQDVLNKLKSGAIRYVSMISTGRHIRLLSRETAVVHGSEEDEVEQAGKRCVIRYIFMDAVVKRNGEWQIAASQLARPVDIQ